MNYFLKKLKATLKIIEGLIRIKSLIQELLK